ncbi:DUF485 domain-containing protein [Paraburkholderia sp. SIMBA_049]
MEQPIPAAAAAALQSVSAPAPVPALLHDSRFRDLVRKRRLFAWSLTILMLTIYFAFILSLAFSPQFLGQPIVQGQPTTWGIPVGFGMFVVTFALVAIYVFQANAVHDAMVEKIRQGDAQ